MKSPLILLAALLAGCASASAEPRTAADTWSSAQTRDILDKTQTIRLAPDLSHLAAGERTAVAKLLEVGDIFQGLYELQRHRAAPRVRRELAARTDAEGRDLATLYRLFQGPIATTLDNKRLPFAGAEAPPPGKNVYPWDLTADEFEAYLAANPGQRTSLTHLRSVVRRATAEDLARDLAQLRRYPVLDTLHPGLRARLEAMAPAPDRAKLYAVPYSVAYADEMIRAQALLNDAAAAVEGHDWEFSKFLRNRARDLLSDDYESGDAAWIKGEFKNLNAQIGAYETYDDELTGTRAFYSLSLLANRREEGDAGHPGARGLASL